MLSAINNGYFKILITLFDCVLHIEIHTHCAHTTNVYVMYIYHTCVHMLYSHGTNASIYAMPVLPICTCVVYLYHAHTCRDTLDILTCVYYIHIKLYIHAHVVHMWVYIPM